MSKMYPSHVISKYYKHHPLPVHLKYCFMGNEISCKLFMNDLTNFYIYEFKNKLNHSILLHFKSHSYPFGELNTTHVPNIVELMNMINTVNNELNGNIFVLKLIVMKREWITSIVSSCINRFGQCKTRINMHANLLKIINDQIKNISKSCWILLNYDKFVQNPFKYKYNISTLFNINYNNISVLDAGLSVVNTNKCSDNYIQKAWNKIESPQLKRLIMDKFYSVNASNNAPLFYSDNNNNNHKCFISKLLLKYNNYEYNNKIWHNINKLQHQNQYGNISLYFLYDLHNTRGAFGSQINNIASKFRTCSYSKSKVFVTTNSFLFTPDKYIKNYTQINKGFDYFFKPLIDENIINLQGSEIKNMVPTYDDRECLKNYVLSLRNKEDMFIRYILRLNNNTLKEIINEIEMIYKYYSNEFKDYNINNSISVPIRGSDKCINNIFPYSFNTFKGKKHWSNCFTLDEYIEIILFIKQYINKDLNTIFVNSEMTQIVQYIMENKRLKEYNFNVITNVFDYHPNRAVTPKQTKTNNDMISMLTSLYLNSLCCKYFIIYSPSNWLRLIASIARLYPLNVDNHKFGMKHIYYLSAKAMIGKPRGIFNKIENNTKYIKFDSNTIQKLNFVNKHIVIHDRFGMKIVDQMNANITHNLQYLMTTNN
eukprot:254501_1